MEFVFAKRIMQIVVFIKTSTTARLLEHSLMACDRKGWYIRININARYRSANEGRSVLWVGRDIRNMCRGQLLRCYLGVF